MLLCLWPALLATIILFQLTTDHDLTIFIIVWTFWFLAVIFYTLQSVFVFHFLEIPNMLIFSAISYVAS